MGRHHPEGVPRAVGNTERAWSSGDSRRKAQGCREQAVSLRIRDGGKTNRNGGVTALPPLMA